MRYQSIWLRSRRLLIPTVAVTPSGILCEVSPVEVLDPSVQVLAPQLERQLNTPMLKVPDRARDNWPIPVVVRAAGLKSWSTFRKSAVSCVVQENDGDWQITFAPDDVHSEQVTLPGGVAFPEMARVVLDGLMHTFLR